MMQNLFRAGALALVAGAVQISPAGAQEGFPLGPTQRNGQFVAPYFEGWYANPDGTYTLSFGYYNAN